MTDNLFNAFVTTDQEDYAPGSTATVTTSGFGVGETVEFSVAHVDPGADGVVGTADDSLVHDLSGTTASWAVTDGGAGDLDGVANGVIVTSWSVNQDAANQAFVLTASNTAGATATATFTDSGQGDGTLLAPTGQAPTGISYNPQKWAVLDGDTITDTIVGADDALVDAVTGTVQVEIKSSEHGNQVVTGTFDHDGADNILGTSDDDAITFTWKVQAADGSDICSTLVVSYQTGVTGGGQPEFSIAGGGAKQGYGVVDADGSPHVCVDDLQVSWDFFKDVTAVDEGTHEDCLPAPIVEEHGNPNLGQPTQAIIDHEGQVVTYTLTLVNDGQVQIGDIAVTDSLLQGNLTETVGNNQDVLDINGTHETISFSGDTDGDKVLDVGETWTWTYTYKVTQADIDNNGNTGDGTIHNEATVVSTDSNVADALADLGVNPVTWSTDVEVCWHPNWDFFKDVTAVGEGTQDGCAPEAIVEEHGNPALGTPTQAVIDHAGQLVTYTLTLVNDGTVSIDNITVTDTLLQGNLTKTVGNGQDVVDINGTHETISFSGDTDGDQVLDVGETWTWTYTYQVTQGDIDNNGNTGDGSIHNEATVETSDANVADALAAIDANPTTWSTDVAVCYHPDVEITKYIVCPDGDLHDANNSINLLEDDDGLVAYRIVVTNTGNVTLHPTVTDTVTADLGAPVETGGDATLNHNGVLDVGETWTYNYTVDWSAGGPHENTASVDTTETTSPVTDPASYVGLTAGISVDKKTNGLDSLGNVPAGVTHITWTYDVKNTGDIGLTNVVITDDNGSVSTSDDFHPTYVSGDDNSNGVLDPGETWHYSYDGGLAKSGDYTNTATVTADSVQDDCGETAAVDDDDTSSYHGTFTPGTPGLTAGFWSQHFRAWDTLDNPVVKGGYNLNSLVSSGVLEKTDVLADLSCVGKLLIGDANGNNSADIGEAILKIDTLDIALKLVSASLSTKSDARLNMLQQTVASQLNIDNHEGATSNGGPGGYGADSLIGTAAKWLLGGLTFEAGGTNAAFTVDTNANGRLDSLDFSNLAKLVFSGNAVSTSSTDWSGKFLIDSDNSYLNNDTVVATGADLKNALEAYNQGNLVISTDGSQIAWAGDANVYANNQDGLWKVLIDHGIGSHHV